MENLELVIPEEEFRKDYLAYIKEVLEIDKKIIPYALYCGIEDYNKAFDMLLGQKERIIPEGKVPSTCYFLVNRGEKRILGSLDIRHELNEGLLIRGGHIGYGVRPSERRKGLGTKMLFLGLEKAREIGIEKALITCSKNNAGSRNVIIGNGGELENETEYEGERILRFWVNTRIKQNI